MKKFLIEDYTKKVVDGLLEQWPQKFKDYVGITAKSVEEIAADYRDKYGLVKWTIGEYWENNVDVDEAIDRLYEPLNRYFVGSASVM